MLAKLPEAGRSAGRGIEVESARQEVVRRKSKKRNNFCIVAEGIMGGHDSQLNLQ